MGMRSYRIMEALSAVDEELLERCGQTCGHGRGAGFARGISDASRPIWRYAGIWAAVLCFGVVGGASWGGYRLMKGAGNDASSQSGGEVNGQMYQEMYDGGNAEEEKTPEDPEAYPEEGQEPESSVYNDSVESDGIDDFGSTDGNNNGADNMAAAGSAGDSGNINDSDATKENMESQLCKRSEVKLYTLEEAQALEGLGGYIPGWLPAGYAFEGGAYYQDPGRSLTVVWSRGADSIKLTIEDKEGPVSTVNADTPEAYDKRLYEAPYGETVPAEYGEIFWNPVFAHEDFNLEIVKGRMVSYEDAGDTNMPRGYFGVLYPEGVLVSFEGCGTAEEIWEMFCSIGEGAQ